MKEQAIKWLKEQLDNKIGIIKMYEKNLNDYIVGSDRHKQEMEYLTEYIQEQEIIEYLIKKLKGKIK